MAGEVRYRVSFRINSCAERASACQARACTGAEGFIHSEESVFINSICFDPEYLSTKTAKYLAPVPLAVRTLPDRSV